YWAKIEQSDLTRASRVKEIGASILYDNVERDLAFGILYGKKENSSHADSIKGDPNNDGTSTALGSTNVKVTDLYFAKKFGDLGLAAEVPILSGEIGNFFENGTTTKYKAKAIILESSYAISDSWKISFWSGKVSGQGQPTNSFDAM